jgi:hypothetical protein
MSRRCTIHRVVPDAEMVELEERIQAGEADFYRRRAIYYDLCAEILFGVPEMVKF